MNNPSDVEIEYFDGTKIKFVTQPEEVNVVPLYIKHHEIQKNDIVLDLGAFEGIFSLYVGMKNTSGLVFSFEPDLRCFNVLSRNIFLNEMKNIYSLPFAVSDFSGKDILRYRKNRNSSCLDGVLSKPSYEDIETQKCFCFSIDDFVQTLNLDRVDFIKMDIESAEIGALKGCEKTIKKYHPDFAIASYHILDGKETSLFVEDFLKKRGYSVETGGFHKTTWGF